MTRNVGLGGGGNMAGAVFSPYDTKKMFLICDMSGLYRTTDGGDHWQMVESDEMISSGIDLGFIPAFSIPVVYDPNDANTVYAYTPIGSWGLRVTKDFGATWTMIWDGSAPALPRGTTVTALATAPGSTGTRLFLGTDAGVVEFDLTNKTFSTSGSATARVVRFVQLSLSGAMLLLAATQNSVLKLDLASNAWSDISGSLGTLGTGNILDFAAGASGAQIALYALKSDGVVQATSISPNNWSTPAQPPLGGGTYLFVGSATNDPNVVYVAAQTTGGLRRVFLRRTQAGSWTTILDDRSTMVDTEWADDDLGPGFGGPAHGFAVAPSNSNKASFTNYAVVYVTKDAWLTANPTKPWASKYSTAAGTDPVNNRPLWQSEALEVTTTWDYQIDPWNPDAHFIGYTDIGLARSDDGGTRWQHIDLPARMGGGRYNTCYQLVFDEEPAAGSLFARNLWAACSDLHDIPYKIALLPNETPAASPPQYQNSGDHRIYGGAVMRSTDGGLTFVDFSTGTTAGNALPNAPVTSVVVSRRDGANVRSMFAAVYGFGIFRRRQIGLNDADWQDWELIGNAAFADASPNVYRLYLHQANQSLFCVVLATVRSNAFKAGDVWVTSNWALTPVTQVTWDSLRSRSTGLPANCPTGIAFDPRNAKALVLCANDNLDHIPTGTVLAPGVYSTADWTATPTFAWSSLNLPNSGAYAFAPFFDARNNLYVTTTYRGTFVQPPGGTWHPYKPIPFVGTHRITFDDRSEGQFLTTFGGGAWVVPQRDAIVLEQGEFSKALVNATAAKTFRSAFMVVFEAVLPGTELGMQSLTDLTAAPPASFFFDANGTNAVGAGLLSATATSVALEVQSLRVRQRVIFQYDVVFGAASDTLFVDASGNPLPDRAIWLITVKEQYRLATDVQLRNHLAAPFIAHGQTWWLSDDVCAFKLRVGETLFGVQLAVDTANYKSIAGSAQQFLDAVLANLNGAGAATWAPQFDSVRLDPTASNLRWSTLEDGVAVLNFALARVHYPADSNATAHPFAVFFRLCNAMVSGFTFDPAGAYRTQQNAQGQPIPVLGLTPAGAIATYPCFATPRALPPQSMLAQKDTENSKSVSALPNAPTTVFAGCWLDFNQSATNAPVFPATVLPTDFGPYSTGQTIQQHIRNQHQCLIVELRDATDPVPTGASPASHDKLAQRNLTIDWSDNPGAADTHTVQSSFEIKASRPLLGTARRRSEGLGNDQLLIDWSGVPEGTQATLHVPGLDASALVAEMAAQLGPPRLALVDPHTFSVAPAGFSFIPLPPDRAADMPALLTVQLPDDVVYGQHFKVVVRQVDSQTARVDGGFELSIPVGKAADLLPDEERKLAVMKYVAQAVPPTSSWYSVFQRALAQVAARVAGFGGDPAAIPPSPNGGPGDQPGLCNCVRAAVFRLVAALRHGSFWNKLLAIVRFAGDGISCLFR